MDAITSWLAIGLSVEAALLLVWPHVSSGTTARVAMNKSGGPLEGHLVVSLEQAVAAPFATRQLADLGARVIKVERPDGGDFARRYDESVHGEASYFVWLNRSKESITLDVKSPEGRAVFDRLLADADVFIQNLAPGAARRLGLSADRLRSQRSELIVCNISGYGSDGAWSDRKAYDMLIQAEVGFMSLTGTPDTPSRAGISIADIAAGMYAFSGVLTALYERRRTGEGAEHDVSLFDSLAEWMGAPAYYSLNSGRVPDRVGGHHATIAPYGLHSSVDGIPLVIAVQNEREWAAFCRQVLDQPALISDARFATNTSRVAHRAELDALVDARFGELTAVAVERLLTDANVAYARVRPVTDLGNHPALADRDRWRQIQTPGGPIDALLPPIQSTGDVDVRMGPVPSLGEHTTSILASLGYDEAEIETMRTCGAI